MKTKKHKGWQYTIEDEQRGVLYKEIKIPKGWKLLEAEDVILLHKDIKLRNEFNLEDCWFFVNSKDYFPKNVVRFNANSGRAALVWDRYPSFSWVGLGVRFKRKVKK